MRLSISDDVEFDSLELKVRALLGDAPPLPEPPSSMVGEVVSGTYEIVRRIGEGGMGRVFAARHLRTGGEVALKLIRPRHAGEDGFRERFELEARHTAALNHPNIVKVFDYGHDDGLAFIAMELVAGQSVGALLDERRVLPAADAIPICAHALRALHVSHAAGLVHRDIKPDNILVAQDGDSWFVKVVDFGIAHAFAADRGPRSVTGSPHSMAPEQFQADAEITPRADLYALGCTMYAMLSGHPPFCGTFWELAVFHAEQPPPPLEGIPEPLADWVGWLLAKSPDHRPESALAALQALLDVERGQTSTSSVAIHLPRVATSFVGRSDELAALAQLRAEHARLITLVGTGGLGKTRLALEWGHRTARQFAGGAYFCDLSETRTQEGICIAVAKALGVSLGDGSATAAVGRLLAQRGPALVILDNFEQLADHAAATVGEWRRAARDVTFLVTSRHRLALQEECVIDVAPLPTNEIGGDGVRLFLDRATQAHPDFAPDQATCAQIRELVEQLDGLPLAIEMAAARVRTMTPEMVLDRLGERFRLLRSSRRDISERQMTMRATLDWSWDLLNAAEQAALRQCAAFARSFELQAAEAVLDLGDHGDLWVVDVLESLVDKSLVRRLGEDRLALFASVHDYATVKLAESTDEEAARSRHLAYYARLGTDAAIGQRETDRAVFDAHGREIDNLQTAITFGSRARPGDELALCTTALTEYFHLRGPLQTAIELGERVLELLPDSMEKGRLWSSVGLSYVRTGDYAAARDYTQRGLELCQRSDDLPAEARATLQHGFVHLHFGRLAEAKPLLDRGADLADAASIERWRAVARLFQGIVLLSAGQLDAARPVCEDALKLSISAGNKRGEGWVRRVLARMHQHEGEMDKVFTHARRSLDLALELGETASEAWALCALGDALAHAGRFAAAVKHYDSCLKVANECGEAFLIGNVLCRRAETAGWWGHAEAGRWAEEALAALGEDDAYLANAKLTFASLRGDEEPDLAMQLFEEAADLLADKPGTGRADALLRKVALRITTRPQADIIDDIERIRALTAGIDAREIVARCHVEQTRLYLALEQPDAAITTASAANAAMPREKMPAWLQLQDVCVRAQVLLAHGRHDEARMLRQQAFTMSEDFGLYPASPLARLVEETDTLQR